MSRRLYIFRVLKSLLSHDDLVHAFIHCIRRLMKCASPVYLSAVFYFDNKMFELCTRTFRVIHGLDSCICNYCSMFDLMHRRKSLLSPSSCLLFINDPNHVIHPKLSERSSCIILPTIKNTRRADGFVFILYA